MRVIIVAEIIVHQTYNEIINIFSNSSASIQFTGFWKFVIVISNGKLNVNIKHLVGWVHDL